MDALAALRLQIEWGADEALMDAPLDRFAPMPAAKPAPAARLVPAGPAMLAPGPIPFPAPFPAQGPAPGPAPLQAADLAAWRAALDALDIPIRRTASHLVPPTGEPATGLLLIGEAPGPEDDRSGQAFAGHAGQVLDRVLASAGLSRADCMLAFLVPWRPPGGRPLNQGEVAACLPFLHRLIALVGPRHIVMMGNGVVRALAGDVPRNRAWTDVVVPGGAVIPGLQMRKPELWLADSASRAATWAGLLSLRHALTS